MATGQRFSNRRRRLLACSALALVSLCARPAHSRDGVKARDLGVPFDGRPGPWNAITDVPGVQVGHATLVEGEGPLVVGKGPVRTGVTAIFPLGKATSAAVAAGLFSLGGAGEAAGIEFIDELGMLRGPILLTNTLDVGTAQEAAVEWSRRRLEGLGTPDAHSQPVVAATWDGFLNDLHGQHLRHEHVFRALDTAKSGRVEEGNVGGGTGTSSFELKGGIGTSSRLVTTEHGQFRLGALVQAGIGRRSQLRIAGVPVGEHLSGSMPESPVAEPARRVTSPTGNSIAVVIATDARLLTSQLERVARSAALAVGRIGGLGMAGSDDLFLAFSTGSRLPAGDSESEHLRTMTDVDPLLEATLQATEEAVVNALVAARTMKGINGNVAHALPHDRLQKILKQYKRFRGPPQSLDDIRDEVHRTRFFLSFAPAKSIFVTEYYTLGSLRRQPPRGAIFLTAIEYRGSFWDVPVEGHNALEMAARRGFFAYTIDWVGLGESYHPPDGSKIDYRTNADPVSKLVDYIRQARKVAKVDLIGEGHGGEVVSVLAADSERIRSVVMTNMYYRALGAAKQFFTPEFKAFLEAAPAGYWVPNVMAKTLFSVRNQEIRDYVFASQKDLEVPVGPFLGIYGTGPLTSTAKNARVPALILTPEHGALAGPGDMEQLKVDWGGGAKLVTVGGSHHLSRMESPEVAEEYFRELFSFLDR